MADDRPSYYTLDEIYAVAQAGDILRAREMFNASVRFQSREAAREATPPDPFKGCDPRDAAPAPPAGETARKWSDIRWAVKCPHCNGQGWIDPTAREGLASLFCEDYIKILQPFVDALAAWLAQEPGENK